jgi:UDP-N-acetylmuramate--alanine ligase
MDLNNIKKIYFIGIGGIGISAIAKLMKSKGKKVLGSDRSKSPITETLSLSDIQVYNEHKKENITQDIDLIIYTIAIDEKNPEIKQAKKYKIPCLSYPQMLGVISKNMQTIAISGTHGKTTTTAMTAKVLKDNSFDPTLIVGSLLSKEKSNLIIGKSKYFVVEACEYKRSFLNLSPNMLAITNIDNDHLDYYKDITDIQSAFRELALKIAQNGYLICDSKNRKIKPVIKNLVCKIVDYRKYINPKIKLKIAGKHNRQNAAIALAIADILKIKKRKAEKSLLDFSGTWRRTEYKGMTKNGVTLYDDYGHHPSEIKATLSGLKEMYPNKKIIAFFQPHLFSRTKLLLTEFSKSFQRTEASYIMPIYPAREKPDLTINSSMLVDKIKQNKKKAFLVENFDQVKNMIESLDKQHLVVTLGAGDIYNLYKKLALKI